MDSPIPERTAFQGWLLRMTAKGAGIDAGPGQLSNQERRDADQLVVEGLLTKTSNHTRDKYGIYVAPEPKRSTTTPPKEPHE